MKGVFKRADIILFSLIALALVFASLILVVTKSFGSYVTVSVNGRVIGQFPLNKDGEYTVNDSSNTIVVKDGTVCVRSSTCPDKLCEKTGVIRYSGQSIICLPNKLTVTITGTEDLDFII